MVSGGVASPHDPIWNIQYSSEELKAIVEEAHHWNTYVMAHAYSPEAISHALNCGVRTIEHANLIDAETARLAVEKEAYIVPTLITYFAMEKKAGEMQELVGLFKKQWDLFTGKIDSLGKSLGALSNHYEDLKGPRLRELEKPMDKISELQLGQDKPQKGMTID